MSTPRLLLDEMLSGAIANQLSRQGYDAVAVVEDRSRVSDAVPRAGTEIFLRRPP